MSWGDIFFSFKGRLNRKYYWFASILVTLVALVFNAALSYLATGKPFAFEVWQRPANQAFVWAPVWLAYFAFLAWPLSALAVKRLHDRNRPDWLWYLYFALSVALSLVPIRENNATEPNLFLEAVFAFYLIYGAYIFMELGVLRGTVGRNPYGEDPLPADYYGGDYDFWSLMLAPEGRISRAKWWLGVLIASAVGVVAFLAMASAISFVFGQHPELQENFQNPEWINGEKGRAIMTQIMLLCAVPALLFCFVISSLTALGVKRLHDRGLSGWLILVVLLPFIGVLLAPVLSEEAEMNASYLRLALLLFAASVIWSFLQFGILKGDVGPNSHGPDPLAG